MKPNQKKDDPYFYFKLAGLLILGSIGLLILTIVGPLAGFFIFVPWFIWKLYTVEKSKKKGP